MQNPFSKIFQESSVYDTETRGEGNSVEIYTPSDFVAGFVDIPRGVAPIEAAWHAAASTLETERIRLIHCVADNGVYFIAASTADFASHPDAITPLASALPNSEGYKGEGAYLIEMGSGALAVIVKGQKSLRSYIGERGNALRFAGDAPQYRPTECQRWVGYSELEYAMARKVTKAAIFSGFLFTVLFVGLAVAAAALSGKINIRSDAALKGLAETQVATAARMNEASTLNLYSDYKKLSDSVVSMGGTIIQYKADKSGVKFTANLPLWSTELTALGAGIKTRTEQNHVVVTKD